jgi:superfamily II DNA/RNA helicase
VSFAELGVPSEIVSRLARRDITDPTPIQAATLAAALAGRDVCGRAPTGSGKTIAFGVPLAARVGRARTRRPRALVLVPTRELASQVERELRWLAKDRTVGAFYGGVGFERQLKLLGSGCDIAVACPGRLADLVRQGHCRLDEVDLVVVDEADRMADMGFLPEVRALLDQVSPTRQTLLFSATLDGAVDDLVKSYQDDPVRHSVVNPADGSRVRHLFWSVAVAKRVSMTARAVESAGPTMVFCRTRHGADRVAKQMAGAGISVEAIHGARSQSRREFALRAFQQGTIQALVATDVAARGIHVDGVACVIHFDLPADEKDYVHRSGRTGRAGADGFVVTMVVPDQVKVARRLQRLLGLPEGLEDGDVSVLDPGPNGHAPRRNVPTAAAEPANRAARRALEVDRTDRSERAAARPGRAGSGLKGAGQGRRRPWEEDSSRPARPGPGAERRPAGGPAPASSPVADRDDRSARRPRPEAGASRDGDARSGRNGAEAFDGRPARPKSGTAGGRPKDGARDGRAGGPATAGGRPRPMGTSAGRGRPGGAPKAGKAAGRGRRA